MTVISNISSTISGDASLDISTILIPRINSISDFIPTSITGLRLWLDGDDASTITSSSNDVSAWDDKSGNGNHATQPTSNTQPSTGIATINGINTISFDGVDDYLLGGPLNITGSNAATLFIVLETPAASGSDNNIFSFGSTIASGGTLIALEITSDNNTSGFRYNNGNRLYDYTHDDVPTLTRWQWADNDNYGAHDLYIDGVLQTQTSVGSSTNIPNVGNDEYLIGTRRDTVGGFVGFGQSQIGEIIIYDRLLTVQEISDTENYLNTKWFQPQISSSFTWGNGEIITWGDGTEIIV